MTYLIYNRSKLLFANTKRDYQGPITEKRGHGTLLGEILS